MEYHENKIVSELENLYLALGQFQNLSETIIQHALSTSDFKVNCFTLLYFNLVVNLEGLTSSSHLIFLNNNMQLIVIIRDEKLLKY